MFHESPLRINILNEHSSRIYQLTESIPISTISLLYIRLVYTHTSRGVKRLSPVSGRSGSGVQRQRFAWWQRAYMRCSAGHARRCYLARRRRDCRESLSRTIGCRVYGRPKESTPPSLPLLTTRRLVFLAIWEFKPPAPSALHGCTLLLCAEWKVEVCARSWCGSVYMTNSLCRVCEVRCVLQGVVSTSGCTLLSRPSCMSAFLNKTLVIIAPAYDAAAALAATGCDSGASTCNKLQISMLQMYYASDEASLNVKPLLVYSLSA